MQKYLRTSAHERPSSGIILTFVKDDRHERPCVLEILAGILGCLAGILGCLPFILVGGKIHKMFAAQGPKAFKYVLLLPLVSFILMVGAMLIFRLFVPQHILIFGIAAIAVFLIGMIVFALIRVRSFKK